MSYLTHTATNDPTVAEWAATDAYKAAEGIKVVCATTTPGPGQSAGYIMAQTLMPHPSEAQAEVMRKIGVLPDRLGRYPLVADVPSDRWHGFRARVDSLAN